MQDVTIPVSIHSFLLCVEFSFLPWCFVILLHFSHVGDVWWSSSFIMSEALIDLFQPCLIVSSKVFQVVFVHLVYNSALFLASCFCPFLLHVMSQMDLYLLSFLSAGSTFISSKVFRSFCHQKGCTLFYWKISSQLLSVFFNPFVEGSKFRFHVKEWGQPLLFLKISGTYLVKNCCLEYPVFE
jgi:hypothetical protein